MCTPLHCSSSLRACGRIFCNECSAHKLQLEHLGYLEPVRVCDECYQLMGGAEDRLREEDKVNAVGGLGAEGSGEEGGKLSQVCVRVLCACACVRVCVCVVLCVLTLKFTSCEYIGRLHCDH